MTTQYSRCCLSSIRLYSGDEGTNHYICNACNEACDTTTAKNSDEELQAAIHDILELQHMCQGRGQTREMYEPAIIEGFLNIFKSEQQATKASVIASIRERMPEMEQPADEGGGFWEGVYIGRNQIIDEVQDILKQVESEEL